MPSYLVRIKHSHEAVGIYSMDDVDELAYCVDEILDPADCEYAEIESGGVVWGRGGAQPVPLSGIDWEREERSALFVVGAPDLNETWSAELSSLDLEFIPLIDPSDVPANDP